MILQEYHHTLESMIEDNLSLKRLYCLFTITRDLHSLTIPLAAPTSDFATLENVRAYIAMINIQSVMPTIEILETDQYSDLTAAGIDQLTAVRKHIL